MRMKCKIKPTQMCIYIDEHVYEKDHDVEKIFRYLQKLFYILAVHERYFKNYNDCMQFALFSATRTYMRLTNKRQFLPDSDPRKLSKIKSILNWIKKVLYPSKVEYQKYAYNEVFKQDESPKELMQEVKNQLESNIKTRVTNDLLRIDVECYFNTIERTIKNFLKRSVYANDPLISKNLYISCILTFLRSITISRKNSKKIFNSKNSFKLNSDETLNSIYENESLSSPIVWHLNKNMKDYVAVLVNEIKSLVCRDIMELTRYYDSTEELLKNILMEPVLDLSEDED